MDSDSDTVDGQYYPTLHSPYLCSISGYPSRGVELPKRVPRSTRFTDPDDFVHHVYSDLVVQMDDWIWELDDIQESVRSRKFFTGDTPEVHPFSDTAIRNSGLDDGLNAEERPVFEPEKYVTEHFAFATDHRVDWGLDHDRVHYGQDSIAKPTDDEMDNRYDAPTDDDVVPDLALPNDQVDKAENGDDYNDVGYAKLDAAINEEWGRLKRIQEQIEKVKSSLEKVGDFHRFLPDKPPRPISAAA
ncbi:uncharacterized protein DSM5745_03188 [Aspergillus mulundensis]|uniref:Uncharacterized protein n=1 Tax=Aspergillus mulundensis TaxID=1810919 RepID=A0A3D8SJS9_9EURO|nr:hypothetical protein DSM5745_03188 [Aspergillus mulundensis]RDW86546.1 hypothetical protein DSM5745_03188 [Aspergillus mulundensis]